MSEMKDTTKRYNPIEVVIWGPAAEYLDRRNDHGTSDAIEKSSHKYTEDDLGSAITEEDAQQT